ncbi:MAG: class I adenylate-forming enzyme family protein [Pseudomonadales bacterium]
MNVMMLLEMASATFPDRVAFIDSSDGTSLTYEQLFRAAGQRAAGLQTAGHSRMAMLDVTSLATPLGLFTSAWAGLPYVPLNYRLTGAEIQALLQRVTPAYLVTDVERHGEFHGLPDVVATTRSHFLDDAHHDGAPGEWPMDPDDIAVLLFTSGTTGAPKAAVLRHKHLVSYILGSVEFASADEHEAALVTVPPYHVAGIAAILSSVYAGRRVVQLSAFTPQAWLDVARREAVTSAFLVPTMLARIIEALEGQQTADLPALASVSYGGGKMPLPVIERAMALFPDTDFTNAYGLTETSSTISLLGPDEHRAAAASRDPALRRRLASVGQALPGVEIQIRDDEGRVLGPNQRGEIYVRGEQVSGEYEGRGHTTDAEGWFPTRDAGSVDAEGYLFLEGRADDVIVRGGENMSPGEIEDTLIGHPAVRDAAVVGVADEQWGEAVAAVVVLTPGRTADAAELQAWVKTHMRSSRVPQTVVFVDELPYTETGKLLRRVVREWLAVPDGG